MKLLASFACALAFVLACGRAVAQPIALPPPPQAGVVQQPGAQVPLALPLLDEAGRPTSLGAIMAAGQPVLLVPGYYSCPELCGLVMHGLLEALHASGLAPDAVRIVRVSIDAQDTPATAAAARARDLAYAAFLGGAAPDLHLLVGSESSTAAVARAVGYRYQSVDAAQRSGEPAARYAHPAVVVLVTPQGKVSRYFMGVRFDPRQLRSAVAGASRGDVGSITDRIALLCAHFDPRVGRHSELVMNLMRGVGLLTLAALAGWTWRRRAGAGGAR
jgi:protein SCO1